MQVKLQDMYNKYYTELPGTRTMPIPTSSVAPPGERYALQRLTYQMHQHDFHVDPTLVDDVMKSLW
jgi:hypothetical protein